MGIGTAITALLASGALLFSSAPPAQAMPPQGWCQMRMSVINLALEFGDVWYALELLEDYWARGCG